MSALTEAFLHLPDIGPERVKQLHARGLHTWTDLLGAPEHGLPWGSERHARITHMLRCCTEAVEQDDIGFFTRTLARKDHWRILDHWFDRASYFDIETDGVHTGARITLIACLHRGRLQLFTAGHNLDAFLDVLDEVELLVSFNGASFDVPKVEDAFSIPALPCPHVDLRWLCYHAGLQGGLKCIEKEIGLERPPDLEGVDGEQAVWLWQAYRDEGRTDALDKLSRYCAADVLSLQILGDRLLRSCNPSFNAVLPSQPWAALEQLTLPPMEQPKPPEAALADRPVNEASPLERRMREHLRRKRDRTC